MFGITIILANARTIDTHVKKLRKQIRRLRKIHSYYLGNGIQVRGKLMKKSIRYKMAALIVIIMTLSMASLVIYSSLFMEKYYTKTKQDSIKEVYYKIKQVVKEDSTFSDDSSTKSVNKTCEKAGATSIVVDDSGNVVYDYGAGKMLEDRWRDIIFGRNIMQNKTPTLVEKRQW